MKDFEARVNDDANKRVHNNCIDMMSTTTLLINGEAIVIGCYLGTPTNSININTGIGNTTATQ